MRDSARRMFGAKFLYCGPTPSPPPPPPRRDGTCGPWFLSACAGFGAHTWRPAEGGGGLTCTTMHPRGGTASLKVGTHCQTTAPAFWHCPPLNLFLQPPIFEGHRPPPPKIKHSLYKIIYKCDPKSSKWLST